MRYFRFVCNNGYCGCDEEFYETFDDGVTEEEIWKVADNFLYNSYNWFTDYDDFVEDFFDEDEDYDAAVEEYQCNCVVDYEEISEEEYNSCC